MTHPDLAKPSRTRHPKTDESLFDWAHPDQEDSFVFG